MYIYIHIHISGFLELQFIDPDARVVLWVNSQQAFHVLVHILEQGLILSDNNTLATTSPHKNFPIQYVAFNGTLNTLTPCFSCNFQRIIISRIQSMIRMVITKDDIKNFMETN